MRRLSVGAGINLRLIVLFLVLLLGACDSEPEIPIAVEVTRSIGGTSDYQTELLADGQLTFVEYEDAMFRFVDCLRDAGIDAGGPDLSEGGLTYSFSVPNPDPGNEESVGRSMGDCDVEHKSVVERQWIDGIGPTPDESEAFYQSVVDCIRGRGMEIASTRSEDLETAIDENPRLYDQCLRSAVERHYNVAME